MKLKFISLNLWWGGNLSPQIIDFLQAENADVVVLQEVHDGRDPALKARLRSMQVLKEKLGYPYQDFAKALMLRLPEGLLPSGNAVLSKYKIVETANTFLFDPTRKAYEDIPEHWAIAPRLLQRARLDTPVGEVNVFNIHGIWDLDGDRPSPERRTMVERTLAAVKGQPNVILAGDTNATTGNPLLRDIEAKLTTVFGSELKSTFNMRHKTDPGYATAAVDHMYVSPGIKVLSKSCPDVDVSDHLPLVVELEIT